ncbi:MAG: hypothetical protein D6712_07330 [Chloroflexi bacterium]|nr:MAG: hypothetical protein D6712_07330 [Chloroflexota bacterium]
MDKIQFIWDDEAHTALRVEWYPNWTWDDYDYAIKKAVEMLGEQIATIPTINVYHPGTRLPKGSPIPHFNRMARKMPQNVAVLVTQDPVTAREVSIFIRMSGYEDGVNFWVVPTLEEARRVVREYLDKKSSQGQAE